jgi:sulfite reductase (NADPH) flavoprotein alpha-component
LIDRAECDVEYEATAKTWTELLWQKMTPANGASHVANSGGTTNGVATTTETQPDLKTKGAFSKTNPFPSKVLHSRLLNGAGSAKQVYHHEISLKESGLEYQVGDALGVYPKNCPELVSLTLTAAGCTGEENVTVSGEVKLLRDALTNDFDLLKPSGELIAKVAANSKDPLFTHLTGDGKSEELKKWLFGRDVTDILTLSGKKIEVTELVPLLRKLSPRLYSISSSPKAHPDEVHLTVGAVRYEVHGRSRKGVASTYLADRISPEERVRVFVQTSHGFRLPTDQSAPIIMVGPGTGIAPFRAFLEEREATGSKGRNWLFFGDQKRSTDYLYQEQIEGWISKGFLTRLDLAFSRDQAEKIYVQDRMAENGREIWDWLQAGAYFYVCGDASRMAKDVDACLHSIIQKEGGMDAGAATLYVSQLKSSKRYQRDVY